MTYFVYALKEKTVSENLPRVFYMFGSEADWEEIQFLYFLV